MKKLITICAVVLVVWAVSSPVPVSATSISLVPETANAALGSTVNVSVDMSVSPGFALPCFDLIITYDSDVFTFVDPPDSLFEEGNLLTQAYSIMGAAVVPGTLRVCTFALGYDPVTLEIYPTYGDDLADGASGTLFTFSLIVNSDAALGSSDLTFAHEDESLGGTFGTDWGINDGYYNYVQVTDIDGSVNIIPEPATIGLLTLGGLLLRRKK